MTRKKKNKYPYLEHSLLIAIVLLIILLALTYLDVIHKPQLEISNTTGSQIEVDPYLHEEEAVIISSDTEEGEIVPIEKVLFEYIEVVDSCAHNFAGECLNVRSAPSLEAPVVQQLRSGIVLKVGGKVENDGITWYQIVFDEWLRYPERVVGDWYVAADYVEVLLDEGARDTPTGGNGTTSKQIIVDRSEQKLYAYDGDELYMETDISTGLELSPTPRGNFTIFRKTPSRYMQGPLPYLENSDYYDLPGVPWNLYFTEQGAVIHGAYWHSSFGKPYSHGCVNADPAIARELYNWAELGTKVLVRD